MPYKAVKRPSKASKGIILIFAELAICQNASSMSVPGLMLGRETAGFDWAILEARFNIQISLLED
jgi:hypothetical protein